MTAKEGPARAAASGSDDEADEVRRSRLTAQRLETRSTRGALETVRRLVGVQAQVPSAAALALRVRTADLREASIGPRLAGGRALVRTWLMRGTIHVVAAEDAGWLRDLLRPGVLRGSRRRYEQLGLDPTTLGRAVEVLAGLVASGPRTRSELFAGLTEAGFDPAGQRGIHLIGHAAWQGVLAFRPDRDGETAWGATGVRDGAAPDRESGLAELARRYVAGYGASDPRDLATWSGLSVADARLGWRLAELPEHSGLPSDGSVRRGRTARTGRTGPPAKTAGAPGSPDDGPAVRLLPHFDPYLLGYRTRDHVVPREFARVVWTGGGFVLPTVVLDGRAIGTWRSDRRGDRVEISVQPFGATRLNAATQAGIDDEVADIARFLDRPAEWHRTTG